MRAGHHGQRAHLGEQHGIVEADKHVLPTQEVWEPDAGPGSSHLWYHGMMPGRHTLQVMDHTLQVMDHTLQVMDLTRADNKSRKIVAFMAHLACKANYDWQKLPHGR